MNSSAPRFRDIPQFTRSSKYRVDVGWQWLEDSIAGWQRDADSLGFSFELDPDFQRAHVWDREKQLRYVEFILRGGKSSREIYFNCPDWMRSNVTKGGRFVLVDGKQRFEAVRAFLRGDFPVFGHRYAEYTDRLPLHCSFSVNINDLTTDAEVLQWYLDLNDGGVVHTSEELARVRAMLAATWSR